MSSCEHKSSAPKELDVPTAIISTGTMVRLPDAVQHHVHVDSTYLEEGKCAAVNDSSLRVGFLQPDYFAIDNDRLTPKTAIPSPVRQYIGQYMEVTQLAHQRERDRSQLIGELTIKTELGAATDRYITALSHIVINSDNGQLAKYTVVYSFNPQNSELIVFQDQFGKGYREALVKGITACLAEREDLGKDDIAGLQARGYFISIAPYPVDNSVLTGDSTAFTYNPGEISRKKVRVATDN